MTTLHIIGNGFDLAHGIDSKYSDFKKYAWQHARNKSYYLGVLESCYPEKDIESGELMLWSNLEYALGNLNFQEAFALGTEDVEMKDSTKTQLESVKEQMKLAKKGKDKESVSVLKDSLAVLRVRLSEIMNELSGYGMNSGSQSFASN